MFMCEKELDESACVCNKNIWETGCEPVMDERVCVRVRQRLVMRMSERESRSSDENVKFPHVKM